MLGKRSIHLTDILLLLVLVAFCGVPLFGALWSGARGSESSVEKRKLADLPAFPTSMEAWMHWPKQFDAYATDRFGFRNILLDGYKSMAVGLFHESASSRAMIGRDGWLFVTGSGSLDDMQGADPYSEQQLGDIVQQINARGELLAAMRIRFGFMVAPDKHSVYPQYLPRGVYAGFANRRLAVLDDAMAETGHDYYVDISGSLRHDAASSPWPLYYKTDTHWNPWGAYLGYRAWSDSAGTTLGLRNFDYKFDQFRQPDHLADGDLAVMSGYRPADPDIWPPSGLGCDVKAWRVPPAVARKIKTLPSHFNEAGCDGNGTALVVHDSFMHALMPYVSSNFKHTWYVWKYLNDDDFGWLVRKFHPDTVIVEQVERLMETFPQTDLTALEDQLSIVGEPAVVGGAGHLTLLHSGRTSSLQQEAISVSLDQVQLDGDELRVTGWAAMGSRPPAVAIVVVSGKIVAEAPVTLLRRDVALAENNPALRWSGFRLDIPVSALTATDHPPNIYVLDFDHYGELPMTPGILRRLQTAARGLKQ